MLIERTHYIEKLSLAIRRSPITALLGPRQCGKTTLAHQLTLDQKVTFFDLESVPDRRRLQNPELALGELEGLIVLDEIQEMPELFPILRVLSDRPNQPARFLILGSASPILIQSASETLAGRVEFVELSGFDLSEASIDLIDTLWLRGGFPRSFLTDTEDDSLSWREGFIRTFLERDIPQLGIRIPATAMRRFWTMLAHYHGQTWNALELSRSMGLSDKTVRSYLDILTGTYMVRQLQPWYENLGKRQVKSPKVYFRDSGLLHSLLDIPDRHSLLSHPKCGASWEGFALEQILNIFEPNQAYFWGVHASAEVDLVFSFKGKLFGFEFKFNEAPLATASMYKAAEELKLEKLYVIHPGRHAFPMAERIVAYPLRDITSLVF